MGARSDDDRDRRFDTDSPIDDAWTTDSPAHDDRTTQGLFVDPAGAARSGGLRKDANHDRTTIGFDAGPVASTIADAQTTNAAGAARIAADVANDRTTAADDEHEQTTLAIRADSEHDRTTVHGGARRPTRALTDPLVASLDQAISELEGPSARAPGSRTFAVLGSEGVTVPRSEECKLVQPERSPLAFVIRDEPPSAAPDTNASGDSSRVVMSLVGDPSPPAVESEASVIPTMQPVLRRARLRRRWMATALAATAVVGTAFAMKLTTSKAPKASAAEAAKATSAVPAAAPAPTPTPAPPTTPTNITPEPPKPSVVPEMAAATESPADAETQEVVGIATTSETSPKPSAKLTTAKTTVAKSSTKKPSTPKNKSTAMAKSSTARKSATAKKKPAPANESSWKRPQRSF